MTKIFTKHISSSNSKDFIETTKVLTSDKQLLSINKYVIIKIFFVKSIKFTQNHAIELKRI